MSAMHRRVAASLGNWRGGELCVKLDSLGAVQEPLARTALVKIADSRQEFQACFTCP